MRRRLKCAAPSIAFTDRYSATNTPRPTAASCKTCEGMGFHPTKCSCRGALPHHKADELLLDYCFVSPCQTCRGTRLIPQ